MWIYCLSDTSSKNSRRVQCMYIVIMMKWGMCPFTHMPIVSDCEVYVYSLFISTISTCMQCITLLLLYFGTAHILPISHLSLSPPKPSWQNYFIHYTVGEPCLTESIILLYAYIICKCTSCRYFKMGGKMSQTLFIFASILFSYCHPFLR